ncbi:glutaredoxin family protein [Halopenitus salinus]|jgi:monothiol glutaredoxin|uniref:Glutaredoxin family protein n=1 Tax=Halopenitus salinus TaxID=1198295 RepID=A0ABD5UVZ5_9EURY
MTFSPESDHDAAAIEERVEETIAENDVVLFMKGNRLMPQCGYSKRAVQLISTHVSEFETVDVLPALPQYREALSDRSDWETIPQTFVDGEFVGGSDVLAELEERGELESTLSTE